ncbi:hypothetical protein BV210_05275 [Halorientalis sp. IM1011]|uniref:DUF7857 domain-containing protein n=1 Tax=Halorientalis sp. IM1011 TaxID=1932360 RepID=UPI00097CC532|nr:hypothetical protein [Halorientalis sp. IM1011]AQL42157.1 hypothetical protein BV210_05275 [Halorientalis sp. IM1011]
MHEEWIDDTDVRRRDGVTFVSATVTNDRSTPQVVRLRSRIDGPTWSPGLGDRPAPEWSGDVWEATVGPGRRRGIGFASPGEPVDEPLEVVSVTRAEDDRAETEEVLADLDAWSPPSDLLAEDP